jgi:hypothetical protein
VLGFGTNDDCNGDKAVHYDKLIYHQLNADRSAGNDKTHSSEQSVFRNCSDDDDVDVDVENVDPFDASSHTDEIRSSASDNITSIRCRVAQNAVPAVDPLEDAANNGCPGGSAELFV